MSKESEGRNTDEEQSSDADHLNDMSDGCGCVEVWENLSDYRRGTD